MGDYRATDKFYVLTAETLVMMREDLLLNIACFLDENELDKAELKLVEEELDRRTRGGMASIHTLMGYILEKEASNG